AGARDLAARARRAGAPARRRKAHGPGRRPSAGRARGLLVGRPRRGRLDRRGRARRALPDARHRRRVGCQRALLGLVVSGCHRDQRRGRGRLSGRASRGARAAGGAV
ncbi:MAG: hypothetical protein AVDCRST_MAG45-817, partial [uncultured Solirubrobacterales bacterium]